MALATDLFKPKREQVLDFIRQRHYAKTSDIIRFGLSIYHTRADRDARDLAQEGRIRRLTEDEKLMAFGKIHEDIWEFVR